MENRLPEAFVERIERDHVDSVAFLEAIEKEPFLSVRINRRKGSAAGDLALENPVAWSGGDGFYLESRPQFTLMPELHAGAFYVQEASSMYLRHVLDFISSELPSSPTCLDLCAAPGGKTTLLMSFLKESKDGSGLVVANEVVRQRAWVLRENVAKWGYPGTVVTNCEASQIADSGLDFDLILVDAPCSGEGMFRKDDVARSEWTEQAAADCAVRQRDILTDIWGALRPGGYMIYSTCTFNPEENERNMEWAVDVLSAEPVAVPVVERQGVTTLPFSGGEGYAFYPHKVRGEGFFVCLLRKPLGGSGRRAIPRKLPKPEVTELGREYVSGMQTYVFDDAVFALPIEISLQTIGMALALKPLMIGTPVGSLLTKGRADERKPIAKGSAKEESRFAKKGGVKAPKATFVPAPELPLSWAFNKDSMSVAEVDKVTALKFLHGDTDLQLPSSCGKAEWVVVSYNGLALGLVKVIGLRLNNYYPKEWRIRMQPVS